MLKLKNGSIFSIIIYMGYIKYFIRARNIYWNKKSNDDTGHLMQEQITFNEASFGVSTKSHARKTKA